MLLTVFNEYAEIRLQCLLHSKSMEGMHEAVVQFIRNLSTHGLPPPELMYLDNPKGEREFWRKMVPSLRRNVVPAPPYNMTELPLAVLPTSVEVQVAATQRDIAFWCSQLHSAWQQTPLGISCEWPAEGPSPASRYGPTTFDETATPRISVITLSTRSKILVLQELRLLSFLPRAYHLLNAAAVIILGRNAHRTGRTASKPSSPKGWPQHLTVCVQDPESLRLPT